MWQFQKKSYKKCLPGLPGLPDPPGKRGKHFRNFSLFWFDLGRMGKSLPSLHSIKNQTNGGRSCLVGERRSNERNPAPHDFIDRSVGKKRNSDSLGAVEGTLRHGRTNRWV